MPILKTTQMIEDVSTVNAREYATARTEATIMLALDDIGTLYRNLLLTDEDDGIWTLNSDVTIPGNVTVVVPLGVTIVGPGNLNILGGIWGMRSPIHHGPGKIFMLNSNTNLGPVMNAANIDYLTNRYFYGQDMYIYNTLYAGNLGDVPVPAPPWPEQGPIIDWDWSSWVFNTDDVPAVKHQSGALYAVNRVRLSSDSHVETGIYGGGASSQVFCNNFQGPWLRAFEAYATAWGGGSIRGAEGIAAVIGIYENTYATQAACVVIYPPYRWGNMGTYYSLIVAGTTWSDPYFGPGTIDNAINIHAYMMQDTIANKSRINMHISGTAPNYFESPLSIGAYPLNTPPGPTYLLQVWGTAQKPGGGTWTDASNSTLKTNIQPLRNALDTLCRLEGKWFEWSEPEHRRVLPGLQVGLMAENVRDVVPEWVQETEDGTLLVTLRGELAYIAEAFKEVKARLEALEGK